MSVAVFEVDCQRTKPGEAVFVVGSASALGGWDASQAAQLSTSPKTFPRWSTGKPLSFPAAEVEVEYKFIIQQATRMGKATWEEFPGNRKLSLCPGKLVTACSVWDRADGTKLALEHVSDDMGDVGQPQAVTRQNTATARLIAEQLEAREPMRKNFSQSLLCLDSSDDDGTIDDAQPIIALCRSTVQDQAQAQVAAEPPTPTPRASVSLKHIGSFSALTEMAGAIEKAEARKTRKRESTYQPYNVNVPVVIVTSEVAPYSKTGGLGLVAASYSYEFPRKGHRTMVVSPKYKHFEGISWVGEAKVWVNGREEAVRYWHKFESSGDGKGCDFIFVDHPAIERQGGLYNADDGREYPDNLFRFTLLSAAAMEAPLLLDIGGRGKYGDKVLFLANDWQAGLVPFYLCHKYRRNGCYSQSRAIYVVHNLGYQGQYPHVQACHFFGCEQHMATDLELGDCVNLSKAALINADRVLTVSPNYTKEIQTPEGGFRLEHIVRAKGDALRLGGILNGIDDVWNPETDKDLHTKYSLDDFETGKAANKLALQRQLGLYEDPGAVLIGFVGRLTWQKGVDVMVQIISWLMEDTGNGVTGRCQIVMMGNGERQYADALRWAEGTFRGRACGYVGFDPKVEHLLMGAADLFLMPSRYEPCGLPQMYSQRYGTLPIVHATGGLVDSVKDVSFGTGEATGFHIWPLSKEKMQEVVYKAVELCLKYPGEFRKMQRNAMSEDFYWPQAMDEYEKAIDTTLYDPPVMR